jgi:hypothetical protein
MTEVFLVGRTAFKLQYTYRFLGVLMGVRYNKKHGMTGTSMYQKWKGIKRRCFNPNEKQYKDYGGRGITICERWANNFEAFLLDMGEPPTEYHSLDRIDVNGNYEPGNCRWATSKEQNRNKRTNVTYEYNGQQYFLIELAEKFKIPFSTLAGRIITLKWSVKKAVETPVASYKKDPVFVWDGQARTIASLAKEYGVDYQLVRNRVANGWDIKDALLKPVRPVKRLMTYEFNGQSRTLTEWSKEYGMKMSTLHARVCRRGWDIGKALTTPIDSTSYRGKA